MRLLLALLLVLLAPPLRAASAEEVAQLWAALQMPRVVAAMRAEGLAYGAQLDDEMLAGAGGARLAAAVSDLYNPGRIEREARDNLARALGEGGIGPVLAFLSSNLGRRSVEAEVRAREALLDPQVEAAARRQARLLRLRDPRRWRQMAEFARAGDLVEANVAAAMNANLAFFQGLAEAGAQGGVPGAAADESEILQQVWQQESAVREDTETWVMAFLTLATAPLDAVDLRTYTAFTASPQGQRLNRALFAAFDPLFIEISRGLGRAIGQELAAQDL